MLILSSPSGAGKTTITKKIQQKYQNFKISVSHTTRKPRSNEVDGVDYYFTSNEEFKKLIKDNKFYEYAKIFDNYYGTSKQAIEEQLAAGIDVFLDIDWQGARQVREIMDDVKTIFILPPSKQELEQRLNNRGQDSAEIIAGRMAQAQSETSHYNEYDYVVVNDDFDTALRDLETIVIAQRLRLKAQTTRHQTLINELLK